MSLKNLKNRLSEVNYNLAELTDEENELFSHVCDIRNNVGKLVRHFKGGCYLITSIAEDYKTGEELVVYKVMSGDYMTYVEPMESFIGKVDKNKYKDTNQDHKFECIEIRLGTELPIKI